MQQTPSSRPINLARLLSHHRKTAWQLTIGASTLMVAVSCFLTGGQAGGWLFGLAGAVTLGFGIRSLLPLWQHDLPLLRDGVPVLAKVVAPVSKDEKQTLYHIHYRLPHERAERDGVFVGPRDSSFAKDEPLLVMVDRNDPGQLLEVTGQYEELMHPVLEKEYA